MGSPRHLRVAHTRPAVQAYPWNTAQQVGHGGRMTGLDLFVCNENAATRLAPLLEFLHAPLEIAELPLDHDGFEVDAEGFQLEHVVERLAIGEAEHPGRHAIADGANFEDVGAGAEGGLAEAAGAIGGRAEACPNQVNVCPAHGDPGLQIHDLSAD